MDNGEMSALVVVPALHDVVVDALPAILAPPADNDSDFEPAVFQEIAPAVLQEIGPQVQRLTGP